MKKYILYLLILIGTSITACTDNDIPHNENDGHNATGNVKLSIIPSSLSMASPTSRAVSASETELNNIDNYTIFAYKDNGDKAYAFNFSTSSLEQTVSMDNGSYRVYIGANLPATYTKEDMPTEDDLKALSYDWNEENKDIMFGFFTQAGDNLYGKEDKYTVPNDTVTKFENDIDRDIRNKGLNQVNPTTYTAPVITINDEIMEAKLTAKLYRMASLVSVYFDSYNLNPEVKITVNQIYLKNVPTSCTLWEENTPTTVSQTDDVIHFDSLVTDNIISDDTRQIYLRRGTSTTGYDSEKNKVRNNTRLMPRFFYIYENRQGTGTNSSIKDKTAGSAGSQKQYASYLEVHATHSISGQNSKKVVYRCVLGEDGENEYNNYNVTRNRHYKVYFTMTGNALGKEASWRIDISETNTDKSSFTPYVDITSSTIRLLDQNAYDAFTADSWSVTVDYTPDVAEGVEWLKIGENTMKEGDTFNNTGEISFNYECVQNIPANVTLKLTYTKNDAIYTQDIELKNTAVSGNHFNYGNSWSKVQNHPYIGNFYEYPTGDELKYNVLTPDSTYLKNNIRVKTDKYFALGSNSTTNTKDLKDAYTLENETITSTNTDQTDESYENTLYFKPIIYENGYYSFDICSDGYFPRKVTFLRNLPLTIGNIVMSCYYDGEKKEVVNTNPDYQFTIKQTDDTYNGINNTVENAFPTINNAEYKGYIHIKNEYIEFTVPTDCKKFSIIAQTKRNNNTKQATIKICEGENDTANKTIVFKAEDGNRIKSVYLEGGKTYRIKKDGGGEPYIFFMAVSK